jgi:hypothetical protein
MEHPFNHLPVKKFVEAPLPTFEYIAVVNRAGTSGRGLLREKLQILVHTFFQKQNLIQIEVVIYSCFHLF